MPTSLHYMAFIKRTPRKPPRTLKTPTAQKSKIGPTFIQLFKSDNIYGNEIEISYDSKRVILQIGQYFDTIRGRRISYNQCHLKRSGRR